MYPRVTLFVALTSSSILMPQHLRPHYSEIGRPSIDPELMVRMLLIGYCFGIRSERRLCEEVHLNLAYRWFCRLGLEDDVPNHSTFSKNRHGRFRDSELFRFVFERVVERCIDEGLVGGEGFAVDASIIKADANSQNALPGKEGIDWSRPGRQSRGVRDYLAALDNDMDAVRAEETTRKAVSLSDPQAGWTSATGGPAFFAYSTNYLIDIGAGIILGVDASRPNVAAEAKAARGMLVHTESRFGLRPQTLIGDTGYGSAEMLGWVVDEHGITPHIPVHDKTQGKAGRYGVADFVWESDAQRYLCPAGKELKAGRRPRKNNPAGVTKANTIIYRATTDDCRSCALKEQCCPKEPSRKIHRHVCEDARDVARSLVNTDAYAQSRKDRKKVEVLFGHLKQILRFDRLRLRGPNGARDEFTLAATAQNLRRLTKLLTLAPLQPVNST